MSVDAVLGVNAGTIVAPAGCGKTHLITETLTVKPLKPYLVLTHTTAGVAALKQRLKRMRVPQGHYYISTIDGWAMRVANMLPTNCPLQTTPNTPKTFYPDLRNTVTKSITAGHLADILPATYGRLLVDEYQDCNLDQHALICALAMHLPTIAFGDPLQCIFNWSGPMPDWQTQVLGHFPVIAELNVPWRWQQAQTSELGYWLLSARTALLNNQRIDLTTCPRHIRCFALTGDHRLNLKNQTQAQYDLRKANNVRDKLLVIGDSQDKNSRHKFASSTNGISVVEPVEIPDIIAAASKMDRRQGLDLADQLIDTASTLMTGVGRSQLKKRLVSIVSGRHRTHPTEIEKGAADIVANNNPQSMLRFLNLLEDSSNTQIYRDGAFSILKRALQLAIDHPQSSFKDAAAKIREQRRHQGEKRIPPKAIGSTLLLKGLETDHALILNADRMNAANLYVALTRAAKSTTVFTTSTALPTIS